MIFRNILAAVSLSVVASLVANYAIAQPIPADNAGADVASTSCPAFLEHTVKKLNSEQTVDVCQQFAGKTLLIVNTASKCGFTPQFKGLEALYQKYKDQGLVILGFPSDDFFQEEDEEKDTAKVCYINYGVTFPMFTTVAVRGDDAHPIFAHLAEQTAAPYWNFYKYLVSKDGNSIERFNSKVSPDSPELIQAIDKQLNADI
ncbi:glutathione peroxidase [Thalassotalea maritima]|uniref:glutathione peroxidase n=1 Tax=Thalassotalea maritima TaxID=3242416 RepID=UPI003528287B